MDDPNVVSPGILGFLAFFLLAVALYLLVRNMNGHLRRMRYRADELERQELDATELDATELDATELDATELEVKDAERPATDEPPAGPPGPVQER